MPASQLPNRLKSAARDIGFHSGALTAAARTRRGQVTILMYHRVLPDGRDPGAVPLSLFAEQMRYLRRAYDVVPLEEALACAEGRRTSHRFGVCVTFDDGYRNTFEHALPVLKRYNIPATVYVTTGSIERGERMWFDELHVRLASSGHAEATVEDETAGTLTVSLDAQNPWRASGKLKAWLRNLPQPRFHAAFNRLMETLPPTPGTDADLHALMTWDEVRAMCEAGVVVGHHTLSHPIMTALSDAELSGEVKDGKRLLEERLSRPVDAFCYPNGAYGPRELEAVAAAGFRSATSCDEGTVRHHSPAMALPRVAAAHQRMTDFAYRLMKPDG